MGERRNYRWLKTVLYILVLFLLMLAFWSQDHYGSDEEELFIKGMQMAQGDVLYVDIITQHMPIMYHVAAIFAYFGIHTVISFRIAFYLLFACLWGVGFWYYGKRLGGMAVGVMPFLYIGIISGIDFGSTVVADQFQAIGMVYLFWALLWFYQTRKICIADAIFISAGIFISFYAAFTSLFAIFIVALTVLFLEVRDALQCKRRFGREIIYLFRKYIVSLLIIVFPSVMLALYYVYLHSFAAFIKWAYTFNRIVYPKYTGGYGSNPLTAFFSGAREFINTFLVTEVTVWVVTQWILVLMAAMFLIAHFLRHKDVFFVVFLGLFVITCATRGIFNFHGLAAVAAMCAMCAMLLGSEVSRMRIGQPASLVKGLALIFCGVFLTNSYWPIFLNLFSISEEDDEPNASAYVINLLTETNEEIGLVSMNYDILMEAEVLPASFGSSDFPWYWEWCGGQEVKELSEDLPRVFYYLPSNTWGHDYGSYAGAMILLVQNNYTSLAELGYPEIYVRNDYYGEALEKLNG